MPKVKKGKRYRKSYDEDVMQKALLEIRQSGSIRTISTKYGIPRSTLQYRLSNHFKKSACGPSPVLTLEEEKSIKKWISTCERTGFPVDKDAIRTTVKRLLDKSNRRTIFKNNYPGNGWYRAFLRRHPDLFSSSSEGFRRSTRQTSEKNWQTSIYEFLKYENSEDILNDPKRVYKADEINFQLCPRTGEIMFHETDTREAKATVSVMLMFSAIGKCTPPVLVFPCRRMLMEMRQSLPNKWGAGLSGLGYVSANIFYDYVSCILHPNLVQDKVKFPVVLFVNGNSAYLSYELHELCSKLQIIPISLNPNANHSKFPQFEDRVLIFKPLKTGWEKVLIKRKIKYSIEVVKKDDFLPVLQNVVTTITPLTIKQGLKADGIFPWSLSINEKHYEQWATDVNCKIEHHKVPGSTKKEPPPVLDFEKFKKIIGSQRLLKLQSGNSNNENSDFKILQKIYNYFIQRDEPYVEQKGENSCNQQPINFSSSLLEGHFIAEQISLPELIKSEPLDLEFENEYNENAPVESFPDSFSEIELLEINIKTENPD